MDNGDGRKATGHFKQLQLKKTKKNGTLLSCPNKNEVRSTQPKSKSILEGFFEHDWSDISQHFVCIHTIHTHY